MIFLTLQNKKKYMYVKFHVHLNNHSTSRLCLEYGNKHCSLKYATNNHTHIVFMFLSIMYHFRFRTITDIGVHNMNSAVNTSG